MWILTVIPESFIHLILAVGVLGIIAGFVLGFVPFISKYKLPIQIISILVTSFAVYLEGALADNLQWQLRVKEMEAKVAEIQAASATKNVEIQERVVEKTKVVRERGRDIIKYVDKIREIPVEVQGPERVKIEKIIEYIDRCPIPAELLKLHNDATEMNKDNKNDAKK